MLRVVCRRRVRISLRSRPESRENVESQVFSFAKERAGAPEVTIWLNSRSPGCRFTPGFVAGDGGTSSIFAFFSRKSSTFSCAIWSYSSLTPLRFCKSLMNLSGGI